MLAQRFYKNTLSRKLCVWTLAIGKYLPLSALFLTYYTSLGKALSLPLTRLPSSQLKPLALLIISLYKESVTRSVLEYTLKIFNFPQLHFQFNLQTDIYTLIPIKGKSITKTMNSHNNKFSAVVENSVNNQSYSMQLDIKTSLRLRHIQMIL